jgi:protoheme IX farnesyltransferase
MRRTAPRCSTGARARPCCCAYAFALWRNYSDQLSRKTFRFSLIHLSLLFLALLVDHYLWLG